MDVTVDIPPGVVATPTKAKNSSNWRETNFMRWNERKMEPLDPWERTTYTGVASPIRKIHRWRDNLNRLWTAIICEGHVYVDDGTSVLVDVSPTPPIDSIVADYTAGGYGEDDYSEDDFGDPRDSRLDMNNIGPAFTAQNWGENLEVMISSDGRLLEWAPPAPGDPIPDMVEVAGSPPGYTFVVTPERHIVIYQYDGIFNGFAWCDQEDNTNWNYADITSKAGNYNVEPASPIIAALNCGDNGSLFFTAAKAYVSRWVGLPDVYTNGDDIGEGVTPISPQSIMRKGDGEAVWVTESGWWGYNGSSIYPIQCDVWQWIIANCNWEAARFKSFGVNITSKSEIWWFFPTEALGDNDRMVIFNYRDGWWSTNRMERTGGFGADFVGLPLLGNGTMVYQHGRGTSYADSDEMPWAESFNFTIKDGFLLSMVRKMMPELEGLASSLRFNLAKRTDRSKVESYSAQRSVQSTGWVEFMESARDFRLRIEQSGPDYADWTVGPMVVDYKVKGKKV